MSSCSKSKHAIRNKIKKEFLLFSCSILLIMCSYSGLADLQSSINIEEGLGTTSLTVTYGSTILFSLLATPVVVRQWGAKTLILVSEACFLVYVVANFYPKFFTLIPAGIVLGFGEATLFTPALMYCTYYGRIFAHIGTKPVNVYVKQFMGYFYCIVQVNEVISNLISYIVLRVGRVIHESNEKAFHPFPSEASNLTSRISNKINSTNQDVFNNNVSFVKLHSFATDFTNCGAADCYDEEYITRTMDQYIPISSAALYIMISILSTLGVTAILIFSYFVPHLPSEIDYSSYKLDDQENEVFSNDKLNVIVHDRNSNCCIAEPKTTQAKNSNLSISELTEENEKFLESTILNTENPSETSLSIVYNTISSTFHHMANKQQLLLTPLTLYHGLYIIFVSSEINRAFVSCIIGVEEIGIAMFFGGISNVLVALAFGALSGRISSTMLMFAAVAGDIACYTFCLLWQPTVDNTWLTYLLCCVLVCTDGIWQPFLDAKYADYFSEKEDIAFAISNLWTCVGFTIMYGWSPYVCMKQKIYTLIGVMIIGLICYGLAEYRRKDKAESTSPHVVVSHVGPSSRL